jgi:hypothetical protein
VVAHGGWGVLGAVVQRLLGGGAAAVAVAVHTARVLQDPGAEAQLPQVVGARQRVPRYRRLVVRRVLGNVGFWEIESNFNS